MTKQVLQSPDSIVLATCRNPSKADALLSLQGKSASAMLHIIRLDVNDTQSIKDAAHEAAQIIGERGIDYLINNAGIVSLPATACYFSCLTLPCLPRQRLEPRRGRQRILVPG